MKKTLWDKIKSMLKSRKTWVAIGTVAADVVVFLVPQLADVHQQLATVITAVGIVLMVTIAAEDVGYWLGAAKELEKK